MNGIFFERNPKEQKRGKRELLARRLQPPLASSSPLLPHMAAVSFHPAPICGGNASSKLGDGFPKPLALPAKLLSPAAGSSRRRSRGELAAASAGSVDNPIAAAADNAPLSVPNPPPVARPKYVSSGGSLRSVSCGAW